MARAYTRYATATVATPQSQPIPGREPEMIANNAGGFGFVLDDWERLMRFLVIGSENGTYYVGEQKLTAENAAVVIRCLKQDGVRAVTMAHDVNVNNRAPKVDQQLFTLALAMKHGDQAAKDAVRRFAPAMLRTGTHLLHFVAMLDSLGGWNRSKRRLISEWFTGHDADWVALQVLKYQNRDGWTMRDVLRVAHPYTTSPRHDAVMAWVCGKLTPEKMEHNALPGILQAHVNMTESVSGPVERALWGISQSLPREALPTEALVSPLIQLAMLPSMPVHALIRNLGNLTSSGLLANSDHAAIVVNKITNKETLARARVHPFAILLATLVYKSGAGFRGSKTWVPVPAILSALEDAYDLAFENVAPTGKRILIGIDTSGSMHMPCVGTPIAASTAAAAMAITLARMEPHATVVQFDTEVRKIVPITKRTGIASLEEHSGGGTDLSAPLRWSMGEESSVRRVLAGKKAEYDAVVLLSDNESWHGRAHTSQVLEAYRKSVNRGTKLVVCAMAASHASVVDPQDALSFGACGLDANLPSLVADFIRR